jgi:DNA replication protein DnaD
MMMMSSLNGNQFYPSRSLEKVLTIRRGLQHITTLSDQLSDQVEQWSSSEIMTHLQSTSSNYYHHNSTMLLVPVLQCVESVIASNSAIITFFHTFLQDLDRVISPRSFQHVGIQNSQC